MSIAHVDVLEALSSIFEQVEQHMGRYDIYLREFPASLRFEQAMEISFRSSSASPPERAKF
jgi:hypothetical protein